MISNEELLKRMAERYQDLVTAINKANPEEIKSLCLSSIATDDDFKEDIVKFNEDLTFEYKGKAYECIPGVSIIDKEELELVADKLVNKHKCSPIFSDLFFVMHNTGYTYEYIKFYYGATLDLKRNGEVPDYVLDAIDKYWEKQGE